MIVKPNLFRCDYSSMSSEQLATHLKCGHPTVQTLLGL